MRLIEYKCTAHKSLCNCRFYARQANRYRCPLCFRLCQVVKMVQVKVMRTFPVGKRKKTGGRKRKETAKKVNVSKGKKTIKKAKERKKKKTIKKKIKEKPVEIGGTPKTLGMKEYKRRWTRKRRQEMREKYGKVLY